MPDLAIKGFVAAEPLQTWAYSVERGALKARRVLTTWHAEALEADDPCALRRLRGQVTGMLSLVEAYLSAAELADSGDTDDETQAAVCTVWAMERLDELVRELRGSGEPSVA